MSGNTEKCDDADWKTPRPSCTCGVGDDAPWSAHLSKRFGYGDYAYSSDQISDLTGERRRASLAALQLQVVQCPVYTWHKGCHGRTPDDKPNATRVRACPHQGCKVKFCVCDNHGGDAEAIRRMVRHLADHITPVTKGEPT